MAAALIRRRLLVLRWITCGVERGASRALLMGSLLFFQSGEVICDSYGRARDSGRGFSVFRPAEAAAFLGCNRAVVDAAMRVYRVQGVAA